MPRACQDKVWICDQLIELNRDDGYGVRGPLLDHASQFLSPDGMRELSDRLWQEAQNTSDKYGQRHCYGLVRSLARQLKDAPLFERAHLAAWPTLPTAFILEIAEVYLEYGQGTGRAVAA